MKAAVKLLVAQLCPTLCNPMDPPLSMEFSRQEYWSGLDILLSKGSSQPRDQSHVSCMAGEFFTI